MNLLKRKAASVFRRLATRYAPPEVMMLVKHLQAQNGIAFPQKNVFITDSVQVESALILSPHPDDEAIGTGGVLSMHMQHGCEVTVLYMTDGRGVGSTNNELIDLRRREAESVGKEFGLQQIFWAVEDTKLTNDSKTVSALVNILKEKKPSLVYLPSFFDFHFDHYAANQILVDALSNVSAFDITVLGYEVWDNMPFPNFIVNISKHFEQKMKMLRHYEEPMKATDFVELCRNRNALHYTLNIDSSICSSTGYAEAFYRFDAKSYCEVFRQSLSALRANGNLLPSHLRPETNPL